MRQFDFAWRCAGCGTVFELRLELEERALNRQVNPATFIAHEKSALAREAASRHAVRGCPRPV